MTVILYDVTVFLYDVAYELLAIILRLRVIFILLPLEMTSRNTYSFLLPIHIYRVIDRIQG